MHRFALPLIVLAALAVAASVAGASQIHIQSGTVFVTERTPLKSSVAAFDAASGELLWKSRTGDAPIGVTKPHGTDKVYTSDESAVPPQLSVFDERTGAFLHAIPMGLRPHHLMASPNGNFIYVGEFGQNTIGVVDTSTDTEVAHYPASAQVTARTHAVWISNDGKNLYATNAGTANTIAKLDAASGARIWEFPIGANPSEILVTQDDKLAYVSVRNEDKIKVVDVSGDVPEVIGEAAAKSQPDTLSLTNDGKTLVVGLRASPLVPARARAALIDTETLKTMYVEMPDHTTTGHQWLSANGKYTFMAVETPGALAVIDNEAAELVTEYGYPDGGLRPHGVFYEPRELR
jgi:DNA-binding beta-propeller fold protein YncE